MFVAGQGPLRDGEYVPGTVEEETRLTLENVGALLTAAGSGFEHVVRCGVWLVDIGEFAAMNSVYVTFFPEPRPARATVGAGSDHGQGRDRLRRARAVSVVVLEAPTLGEGWLAHVAGDPRARARLPPTTGRQRASSRCSRSRRAARRPTTR